MTEDNAFEWPITVYYEDTDVGGLVYHANYIKFFERARTELFRSLGVSLNDLFTEKASFVVRHIDIDYLKGAQLDDQLTVRTWVNNSRRVAIEFCQVLVNNEGQILCKALITVACVHPDTLKPIKIPEKIMSEISK
ncbi:tol-pal system-associated acyl-CoA thioesterase [Photobacterium sanctipauli]|uniref:Tol-pal system-associated acyl-CoA thioesterase n=1 Tax=Photobacterium sanctipauli TaxID=1342794 RepID=A0A2T3NQZ5_9GAMM|nr:tol-pal system-associated acyl-CoA thioesterase [Photobacterium sanctipauli]PSW18694.1 tol-pal system-associated acyl-CoA thioesterase [Photobacterium sanctipauli]